MHGRVVPVRNVAMVGDLGWEDEGARPGVVLDDDVAAHGEGEALVLAVKDKLTRAANNAVVVQEFR